ncbi:thioredoxin family protein [Bacillus sp. OAE603]|uniref:thioredoxin family protein n=1 Tax=Gottfriedia sp. OAE603 TaxID=2663872 RepID=UPI00178949A2
MKKFQEIENFITQNKSAIIFVSGLNCAVCDAVFPLVEELIKAYPSIKLLHTKANEVPELSGQYQVFTVPAILFFFNGKEIARKVRFIREEELIKEFDRLSVFAEQGSMYEN